jgi:acyl carrier protein
MHSKEKILDTIYGAVDDINQQVDENMRLEKSPETVLFGRSGKLDSLGLVNLIVAVEQQIQEDFGISVAIADERAFSQKNSPFKTVESLADYVAVLIAEHADGK